MNNDLMLVRMPHATVKGCSNDCHSNEERMDDASSSYSFRSLVQFLLRISVAGLYSHYLRHPDFLRLSNSLMLLNWIFRYFWFHYWASHAA